jgi:hypothetical protein
MNLRSRAFTCWLLVVAFAVAMAWVESASVYYLRVLVDRVDPYQPDPLPMRGVLGAVELVREAATLVMLLAVGTLAGRTWRARLGYSALAFGAWDIGYYVFLKLMSGWPASLFDWDILFLLPLPWWGPVIAPVCIALLMIVWGTLATQRRDRNPAEHLELRLWAFASAGITLALYVFMTDALRAVRQGHAVDTALPVVFNWPVFVLALTLMTAPIVQTAWTLLPLAADMKHRPRAIPGRQKEKRLGAREVLHQARAAAGSQNEERVVQRVASGARARQHGDAEHPLRGTAGARVHNVRIPHALDLE